jgi:hypothetical protein
MGEQAQTPSLQSPEQQFAALVQSDEVPLQSAQMPEAQTPLQHSEPVWQLSAAALQSHVPALHTPLQHEDPEHFAPCNPQLSAASTPASRCGNVIGAEPSVEASGLVPEDDFDEEPQPARAATRVIRENRSAAVRGLIGCLVSASQSGGARFRAGA